MRKILKDPAWNGIAVITGIVLGIAGLFTASELPPKWKLIGSFAASILVIVGVLLLFFGTCRWWLRDRTAVVREKLKSTLKIVEDYRWAVIVVGVELAILGLIEYHFVGKKSVALALTVGNLAIVISAVYLVDRSREFAKVFVIDPSGKRYRAEIHPEADDEAILSRLILKIGLPQTDQDGQPIRYRINTADA